MIEKKSRTLAVWEWAHARGGEFCVQDVNAAFNLGTIQSHAALTGLVDQGCVTTRYTYEPKAKFHRKVWFTPTDKAPGRKPAPPASDSMKFMVAGKQKRYETLPVIRL